MDITKRDLSLIGIVGLVLFLLGNWAIAITDPVESNYTLTALEMMRSGDYVSPRIYGNYWYDKPAFFYWELIVAYKLFGVNEFAARFFPSVFGVLGLMMTYLFARKLYDRKTGLMAAGILGTCFEYWLLSKTVITDLTLFVFFDAVLIFFYLGYSTGKRSYYYLCYLFAGLATLDKGPIGLLLPGFILLVYIFIRRDFKEILRLKLPQGLLLYALVAGSWYYAMYTIHGMEFVNNFLGVHNFLRATQSEHPQWNVWYYYLMIFFLGCLPWSWTLPAVIRKYIKLKKRPELDMTGSFLLVWALVVNIFYQCMATKYTTYTLPALLPIAILIARYLYDREKLVKRTVGVMLALYAVLTFAVAVPACSNEGYSCKNVAAVYKDRVKADDLVVSYGDYKTSNVFYGDKLVYRLEDAKAIPGMLPDGKSWNAKNVMPFISFEELPEDKDIYLILNNRRFDSFEKDFNTAEWELLESFKNARVYYRKARQ
ncbi:MAG: glycosyltransferase family 39 protein [Anaerovibrio sp.]|uniref:ArnT family glycosyltransferase n=1 Tax=Anaerovibrio sp. TaxID=1872532 RepID=UPI0025CF9EE0|nr:glycosyltransferase family 39 protein [Anaerovibrio sp.]MCR5175220.1 glycosyltransferase family 39 protein [Anaerovibrio sp.]